MIQQVIIILFFLALTCHTLTNYSNVINENNDPMNDKRRLLLQRGLNQKLVWLISFPESGVTYIIHIVQVLSQTSVASNYAQKIIDPEGIPKNVPYSIPAYANRFVPSLLSRTLSVPPYYILTRTHSYGTSFDIPPWEYLGYYASEGHKTINFYASQKTYNSFKIEKYEKDLVEKMVLLIRDPMDTVVARFYHKMNLEKIEMDSTAMKMGGLKTQQYSDKYTLSPEGFRKYCSDSDESQSKARNWNWYKMFGFLEYASKVPCQEEFVKLFEYHNQILKLKNELNLDMLLVTIKDFATNFNSTIKELFDFIKVTRKSEREFEIPNSGGKEFYFFYTNEQRKAVAELAKKMLDPPIWEKYSLYLQEYIVE